MDSTADSSVTMMDTGDPECTKNNNNSRIIVNNRDELSKLDKEQLVDKVISMQQHIKQLKCLINKHNKNNNSKTQQSCKSSKKSQREFNFARFKRRHIFLKFLYLGWNYDGYVAQEGFTNTVEDQLFEALIKTKMIENREGSNYHRCGRTDKGVSAFCQVASLTVRSQIKCGPGLIKPEGFVGNDDDDNDDNGGQDDNDHNPTDIECDEIDYLSALNGVLPKDIRVIGWAPVNSPTISARFDCQKRVYHYYFPRCELDIDRMDQACQHLVGKHDFRNFCKMDINNGVTNYIRRVFSASVRQSVLQHSSSCPDPYSICLFQIEASAYLWHQIRCIMGILFLVGQRLEEPNVVERLLDIEHNPSKPQYMIASDLPLVLYATEYSEHQVPRWFYGNSKTAVKCVLGQLQQEWAKRAIQAAITKSMADSLLQTYRQQFRSEEIKFDQVNGPLNNFLSGVMPKVYIPLFERPVCDSLETRLEKGQSRKKVKLQ